MTAAETTDSSTEKSLRSFEDCAFNRAGFAERLTNTIEFYTQYEKEAYVLSLNAAYGAGKTTFLKMWQQQLKDNGKKVISINAWESDMEEDPTLAIADALLDFFKTEESKLQMNDSGLKEEVKTKIKSVLMTAKKATKAFGAVAYSASNDLVANTIGIDIDKAIQAANEANVTENEKLERRELVELGERIFETYSFKKKLYKHLHESLREYVTALGKGNPLIIMVDELDRVRPTYAVKFLEAIKHIFSVKGVCFVLAVHKGQLEKSIRQLYGNIDFENYYLRFITKEVAFEEVEIADYRKFVEPLWRQYQLQHLENLRQSVSCFDFLAYGATDFKLEPRQVQAVIKLCAYYLKQSEWNHSEYRVKAAILLSFIKYVDNDIYKSLGEDFVSHNDLLAFFQKKRKMVINYENEQYNSDIIWIACAFNHSKLHNAEEARMKLENITSHINGHDLTEWFYKMIRGGPLNNHTFTENNYFKKIYYKLESAKLYHDE